MTEIFKLRTLAIFTSIFVANGEDYNPYETLTLLLDPCPAGVQFVVGLSNLGVK